VLSIDIRYALTDAGIKVDGLRCAVSGALPAQDTLITKAVSGNIGLELPGLLAYTAKAARQRAMRAGIDTFTAEMTITLGEIDNRKAINAFLQQTTWAFITTIAATGAQRQEYRFRQRPGRADEGRRYTRNLRQKP
jgi:hypothetical protein